MDNLQIASGSIAGLIFSAGSLNMLIKAWQTKDLRSYSLGQLVLNNVGNLFYWFYVISLPFGPIYFMHGFFTLVSALMVIWYFAYRPAAENRQAGPREASQRTASLSTYAGRLNAVWPIRR